MTIEERLGQLEQIVMAMHDDVYEAAPEDEDEVTLQRAYRLCWELGIDPSLHYSPEDVAAMRAALRPSEPVSRFSAGLQPEDLYTSSSGLEQ